MAGEAAMTPPGNGEYSRAAICAQGALFLAFFAAAWIVWAFPSAQSQALAEAAQARPCSADELIEHARYRFEAGDYEAAIMEYKRFSYFHPQDPRAAEASFRIAESYFRTARYQKALSHYRHTAETYSTSRWAVSSRFRISRCHLRMKDPTAAVRTLLDLTRKTEEARVRDKAFYRLAWISLERADPAQARVWLARISPDGQKTYQAAALVSDLEELGSIPRKAPFLAGVLSIIPGGGYLYCGRYRDAAIAFGLNAALMGAAWESWENDLEVLGGLLAIVDIGFYAGSIYGGITSAHKYNRARYDEFIGELKTQRFSLDLFRGPDRDEWGLSFTWRF
jgi:tetratricopeptide (TPR) repeat protein